MPHQCIECGRTFPDGSKEMLSGCPDCGGNKFQFQPRSKATDENKAETKQPETGSASGAGPAETAHTEGLTPANGNEPDSNGIGRDDSGPDPNSERPTVDDQDSRSPVTASSSPTADRNSTESGREPTESSREPTESSREPTESREKQNESDPSDTATDAEQLRDDGTEDTAQASARSDVVTPDELDRASQNTAGSDPSNVDTDRDPRPDVDELRHELNEQFESIRIVSPGQYELNLMELYDRQEYIISLQEDGRYVIEMPDAWGVSDE